MKIVIDGFGGDYSPEEIVEGAILGLQKYEDLKIVISGDKERLQSVLLGKLYASDRLEILHAPEVVTNDEPPALAMRRKKLASLPVAFDYLKENEDCKALISAGPTGAILAGGIFKMGRMEGVLRPAMAPLLPTQNGGRVMLLDVGANTSCDSENLMQFAVMGSVYMKSMGVQNPRVGLLNIGAESEKGDDLRKQTYEALKQSKLNFVGNIEARDILKGNVDVVVSDGYSGNIALKAIEGTAEFVLKMLKSELKSSLKNKIGALLMKKSLMKIKQTADYKRFGGAPMLGFDKIILKSHGDSKRDTIAIAIDNVIKLEKENMIENLKKELKIEN